MAYLRSIWALANTSNQTTDSNGNKTNTAAAKLKGLYKYTNSIQDGDKLETGNNPFGICVALDKANVLVTNMEDNTISRYQNGERMVDIDCGGESPFSICQGRFNTINTDPSFYVTNYGSSTVTRITNDTVDKVIPVGQGPRGICADKYGNIWVANYIDGTVTRIQDNDNGTVGTTTIKVATGPEGICADAYGYVWVSCSISNVVTKIKADSGLKIVDISVGSTPRGICANEDSSMIWVTNFKSRSVTRISTKDLSTTEFPVGKSPININVDRDGNIIVFNYDDKSIMELSDNGEKITEIGAISTGYNPVGFGDFTGMQAYMMYNSFSKTNPDGTTKIGWEDLTTELQNIIKTGGSGVTDQIFAKDVIYQSNDNTIPTVQAALDALFGEKNTSEVTTFAISKPVNGYAEVGSVVDSATFIWAYKNNNDANVSSISISSTNQYANVGLITDPGVKEQKVLTVNKLGVHDDIKGLSTNTTFTFTSVDKSAGATKKTAILRFLPKMYWGVSSNQIYDGTSTTTIVNDDGSTSIVANNQIVKLGNNEFLNLMDGETCKKTLYFDCTGGKYIIIALPAAYNLSTTGGITTGNGSAEGTVLSNWNVKQDMLVQNESMYTNKYNVFTLNEIQHGSNIPINITFSLGDANASDLANSDNYTVSSFPGLGK